MSNFSKRRILQGSALNLSQMLLSMAVSLVLPPFLVHHMPPAEYSAWVLILQVSAYVNYLELGMQTAIGKFVAEFDASADRKSIADLLGTSFTILSGAALLGVIAIMIITWKLPQLFHQMPLELVHEVRLGVMAVGSSTAILLPFTIFQGSFVGLQRYVVPAVVVGVSKVVTAVSVIALLVLRGSIVQMALLIALINLLTAAVQYLCWLRYASKDAPLAWFCFQRKLAARLGEYCGVLAIWTMGVLFISGLDTTIVGRFDYANTGYYAVAGSATNFMLLIVGNLLGPLMPAISSLQASSTPAALGALLVRTTRYNALLLCALALPLLVCNYPLLTLWLGRSYAAHSMYFLIVLVLGNFVRQLGYPYALMVVATGNQRLATLSPVAEAVINFSVSIWLAHRMGAIGVAYGTLLGACAGLATHVIVSMHLTQATILVRRTRLLLSGLLRPLTCAVPSLLLLPAWHALQLWPAQPALLLLWLIASAAVAWRVGVDASEREQFLFRVRRLVY